MSVFRLLASVSGPTGEVPRLVGELAMEVTTSASSDRDNFLSVPASLPTRAETQNRWSVRVRDVDRG
jgi:hypothetical protein